MKIAVFVPFLLAGASMFMASAAHAELDFNIGVVSLYKDRGVDQEGKNKSARPAVQGGIDYSWKGLYAGSWASSGRFDNANAEIDVYAGYRFDVSEDIQLDVGYTHYYYPGQADWNSGEVYASIDYRGLMLKVYRGMRRDVNQGDMYYRLSYAYPLTDKIELSAGVGYQHYHMEGLRGKTDFSLGASYAFNDHVVLSGTVAAANRRGDVDDGSRDLRFIGGINFYF